MGQFIQPFLMFGLCVVGGAGVLLALPRGGRSPQVLGALLAGLVLGVALLVLGLNAGHEHPLPYFYIFALTGLGAALRVITHPRPVYAALYFVLTVIATGGLFLLLSAEFMAFSLIIVYAGAILITYLFVIMLATQAPEEGEIEALADYDTSAREPVAATVAGFLLLALLTSFMFKGIPNLRPGELAPAETLLADMPRLIEQNFASHGLLKSGEHVVLDSNKHAIITEAGVKVTGGQGERVIAKSDWPSDLEVTNVERVGFNLLRDHPGTIEIAGVILLMAMLGAVVLSRKQVQIDEEAKRLQAMRLGDNSGGAS
ncbi:MAG: NADH-quinone oxidoreductase subunit J [Phycisphaerales bacterium]